MPTPRAIRELPPAERPRERLQQRGAAGLTSAELIGLLWGFATGFVMGWFVAFCRNLVVAASIFWIRTRAELSANRDFLDHI